MWVGGRRGSISGNDAGADALKRIGDEAVQIARTDYADEDLDVIGNVRRGASRS